MSKSPLLTLLGADLSTALFLLPLLGMSGLLQGAGCRLELIAPVADAPLTCFLDFSAIKPKSETFTLTDHTGQELPFSFDFAYGWPPAAEHEYRREPDGFYSKAMGLLADRQFVRPGWLSFAPRPGQTRYCLSFEDGAEVVSPRSDPALRPWWIELLADPYFRQPLQPPLYYSTKPGALRANSDCGVEFSADQTLFLNRGLFLTDERILGRRLVSCCLLQGQPGARGQYSFPFFSAIRANAPVMHVYYQLPDEQAYAIFCEGLVQPNPVSLWQDRNQRLMFSIDRPGKLLALHLQSPPSEHGLTLKYCGPQLVEPGDEMLFQIGGLQRDILQPASFRLADRRTLSGGWIEHWTQAPPFRARILDQQGKLQQEANQPRFTLSATLPPGKYTLLAELLHPGNSNLTLARTTIALQYQPGPQW